MGWFDDDDWERMKNFTIYNVWMTDEEKDEFFENVGGIVVFILVVIGIIAFVAWLL